MCFMSHESGCGKSRVGLYLSSNIPRVKNESVVVKISILKVFACIKMGVAECRVGHGG